MSKKKRTFCPYCKKKLIRKKDGEVGRDYCSDCQAFFYDNPLPVASTILVDGRQISLVKRRFKPYPGKWCLPSGFVESGETIAEAALRELEEETGIQGRVIRLVDVDTCSNYFYGDLLFLTFEVEQIGGELNAGDDAVAVKYFPMDRIPRLAFSSNRKAVDTFIESKKDDWAIADSFNIAATDESLIDPDNKLLLSDKIIELIEKNSEQIAMIWLDDVVVNKSTPSYHDFDRESLFRRANIVMSHFGQWLDGIYKSNDVRSFYIELGRRRRIEGFELSEVISALSLIKKHVWEFAISENMWHRTIDIYKALELERRMLLFFDKATYYISIGYET